MYEPNPIPGPVPTSGKQATTVKPAATPPTKVVVSETVREIVRPDSVLPYASIACAGAAAGLVVGSMLTHNKEVGAVVMGVIMLVAAALIAIGRYCNTPSEVHHVRTDTQN